MSQFFFKKLLLQMSLWPVRCSPSHWSTLLAEEFIELMRQGEESPGAISLVALEPHAVSGRWYATSDIPLASSG